jgi:hypothetical protein
MHTFHPNFQNDDHYMQEVDTLELAVAPVDEFWRIVREEAMSYAAQEIQKLETEITNLKKEREESIRRAVIHEKSQGRW